MWRHSAGCRRIGVKEKVAHTWKQYCCKARLAERFNTRSAVILLAAGLASAWMRPARADSSDAAGHISDIEGDAANFWIHHENEVRPIGFWANVFDKDMVYIHGPGHVEIMPGGLIVTRNNSPQTINRIAETTIVEARAQGLVRWINPSSGAEAEGRAEQTVTAGTRDVAGLLALPLLTEPYHQRLTAGIRHFTLAWSSGKPPFVATLSGDSGSLLKLTTDPDGAPRASASLNLLPGHYEAEVTDQRGYRRSAAFDAVDDSPDIDEADFATDPEDVRLVMRAVRIARANAGHWRLEAFQRLSEAASHNGVARLLAARLAAGKPLDAAGR